jgi:hypothetical protein
VSCYDPQQQILRVLRVGGWKKKGLSNALMTRNNQFLGYFALEYAKKLIFVSKQPLICDVRFRALNDRLAAFLAVYKWRAQ